MVVGFVTSRCLKSGFGTHFGRLYGLLWFQLSTLVIGKKLDHQTLSHFALSIGPLIPGLPRPYEILEVAASTPEVAFQNPMN